MILQFLEKNKKYAVYIPLVVYWLTLLIATSIPSKSLPEISYSDKTMHFLAYGGLSFLLTLAFMVQKKYPELRGYAVLAAITVATLYGALDEFHQSFIPGRNAEFLDWLADFAGSILGAYLCLGFLRLPVKTGENKSFS
ncbi:MAG: VanZ family protein [Ignavibacteriaceae bacterium]|nr:VanZ family protein [Ignavibacteriaceae bacterium]